MAHNNVKYLDIKSEDDVLTIELTLKEVFDSLTAG